MSIIINYTPTRSSNECKVLHKMRKNLYAIKYRSISISQWSNHNFAISWTKGLKFSKDLCEQSIRLKYISIIMHYISFVRKVGNFLVWSMKLQNAYRAGSFALVSHFLWTAFIRMLKLIIAYDWNVVQSISNKWKCIRGWLKMNTAKSCWIEILSSSNRALLREAHIVRLKF